MKTILCRSEFNGSLILLVALLVISCNSASYEIIDATVMQNYQPEKSEKTLFLDYTGAIDSGFVIPSIRQTSSGYFTFSFTIKNNGADSGYIYKIFYQNETYKFEESNGNKYNPLSAENFYGSWDDPSISFKTIEVVPGKSINISDSIRISGNPRDERIYYGNKLKQPISDQEIYNRMAYIKSDAVWYKSIVEKSIKEKRTTDEQLRLDALYVINEDKNKIISNNRWKRNPRTGMYRFYLLVAPKSVLTDIPSFVREINKKDENGNFINPVFYLQNLSSSRNDIKSVVFPQSLTITAKPDLGSGIYINKSELANKNATTEFYSNSCSEFYNNYKNSHFEQYFHHLPEKFFSPNIPLVKDIQSDELSITDYKNYLNNYTKESLLPYTNYASRCPCETVQSDSVNKKIILKTPGYRRNLLEKENTGVFSRHGFTYGTYTFKVKMPELLNKNHFWNGLTNALWLIDQSNETWNKRRACNGNGYIPKEIPGAENSPRQKEVSYTEIDFEIRKGSPVWPKSSYPKNLSRPPYKQTDSSDIVVLCTNWDLACNEPKDFDAGARIFNHNDKEYILHRWTHWYQALSSKYAASDDELFSGEYYYFQIEWKPNSITWRIGPEKNKLREVCYMDNTVTSIPNNQMLMVFTQEYHISEWWPESQYLQEYIPIPEKDIIGEILEIEIK